MALRTAETIIVGGGVNGVATAYNLARRGMTDVVVLEKSYPGFGATGRCGGGIRQQWGLAENVILARESVRRFENLSAELGFNVFFRQGGYLMLVYDEREYELVNKTIPLHNSLDVPTRFLSPDDITELVPGLNLDGILGGAFCPTDGTAYPYAVLWGYAEAARRLGAQIYNYAEARHVTLRPNGLFQVDTGDDTFEAPRLVNVAGAKTRDIAAQLGIDIPTHPFRHEIAVTEPLLSFLEPMVISPKKGFYFSQSMRGEVVGGIGGGDDEASSHTKQSSPEFLFRYASALREVFPGLGSARIIRQWAGSYDMSPDHRPIVGGVDGVDGYYHACGFSGHGFMLSPVVSQLLSELVLDRPTSLPIDDLNLNRFQSGDLTHDPYVVG
jgi:sarcosine oxidase subunit beta